MVAAFLRSLFEIYILIYSTYFRNSTIWICNRYNIFSLQADCGVQQIAPHQFFGSIMRRMNSALSPNQGKKPETNNLIVLMIFFLFICFVNMLYLKRTSNMLLELENSILRARERAEIRHVTTNPPAILSPDWRTSRPDRLVETKEAKIQEPHAGKAFLGSTNASASIWSAALPMHPIQFPPAADPARPWSKLKWEFRLTSDKSFVLEQISPQDAISYARHYTESMHNRSKPLLRVQSTATDFRRIKRIWIWGAAPSYRKIPHRSRARESRPFNFFSLLQTHPSTHSQRLLLPTFPPNTPLPRKHPPLPRNLFPAPRTPDAPPQASAAAAPRRSRTCSSRTSTSTAPTRPRPATKGAGRGGTRAGPAGPTRPQCRCRRSALSAACRGSTVPPQPLPLSFLPCISPLWPPRPGPGPARADFIRRLMISISILIFR